MLLNLQPQSNEQLSLGFDFEAPRNRPKLMSTLDEINQKWGRGTLRLASAGSPIKQRQWDMKQERRTPAYTTDWNSLIVAN